MSLLSKPLKVNFLLSRFLENLKFDLNWMRNRLPIGVKARAHYLFDKYAAILRDKRKINYLGHTFTYDNRLAPALLQTYPQEIEELNASVDLTKVRVIFDVGANVGQFAWTLKKFAPHVAIFSFEPNPAIFPLLKENASQLNGWHALNFGLASQNARIPFFFVPGKSAQGSAFKGNSIQNLQTQSVETLEIEVRKLDAKTLAAESLPTHVDLLKVDVEGYELEALQGLALISWDYLFIEVSDSREGGVSVPALISLTEQLWRKTPRVIWEGDRSKTARNVLFQMPK